jgi:uncharacterized protein YoxC
MFQQIIELTAQFFSLTKDVQQNKSDIKDVEQEVKELRRDFNDLQREVRDLASAVQRLASFGAAIGKHPAEVRAASAIRPARFGRRGELRRTVTDDPRPSSTL